MMRRRVCSSILVACGLAGLVAGPGGASALAASSAPSEASAAAASGSPAEYAWGPSAAGTAHTVRPGTFEMGLFQPLRYGVGESLEVATHPLLSLLMPNIALKKQWASWGRAGALASQHVLRYPTGLLQAMVRRGAGGVLPAAMRVPHIIDTEHRLLYSVPVAAGHLLSAKLGVQWAAYIGRTSIDSIDLPLAFARSAAYHRHWTARAGVDLDGRIARRWSYFVDVDAFLLPYADARYALEQSAMLSYVPARSWVLQAGYKLTWGPYRYGQSELHLFPMADVLWRF